MDNIKTVYGITPDTKTGKFIIQEAQINEMEYYRLKPSGAIFDDKKDAEKALKKWIKSYNRR